MNTTRELFTKHRYPETKLVAAKNTTLNSKVQQTLSIGESFKISELFGAKIQNGVLYSHQPFSYRLKILGAKIELLAFYHLTGLRIQFCPILSNF